MNTRRKRDVKEPTIGNEPNSLYDVLMKIDEESVAKDLADNAVDESKASSKVVWVDG